MLSFTREDLYIELAVIVVWTVMYYVVFNI